jgi:hypothetical protein
MLWIALVFIWGSRARIYVCTRWGEYTKNHLDQYNNKKANTYLIVTQEQECIRSWREAALVKDRKQWQRRTRAGRRLEDNWADVSLWQADEQVRTGIVARSKWFRRLPHVRFPARWTEPGGDRDEGGGPEDGDVEGLEKRTRCLGLSMHGSSTIRSIPIQWVKKVTG